MSNYSIYYFSGTGNTETACLNLKSELEKNSHAVNIHSISEEFRPTQDDIIIAAPTHGFTLIYPMLKFLFLLPLAKKQHAHIMIVRGGTYFFNRPIWGVSGSAIHLAGLMLFLKGYRLGSFTFLDLPANWSLVHPSLADKSIEILSANATKEIELFARQIPTSTPHRPWKPFAFESIFGLILLKVSFLYVVVFRFILSKTLIASAKCNNCGKCEQLCPSQSIVNSDTIPYWKMSCESCMRCLAVCPTKAIQGNYILILVSMIVAQTLSGGFANALEMMFISTPTQASEIFLITMSMGVTVMLTFIIYHLSYALQKHPLARSIMSEITPTQKYKFYLSKLYRDKHKV